MTYKIIYYPNNKLKQKCKPVTNYKSVEKLVVGMKELLIRQKAKGIAANQVGELKRIFLVDLENEGITTFINPKIKVLNEETMPSQEGCLSIPGNIIANLNCRHKRIEVTAKNIKGEEFVLILSNYDSIATEHEYDHLEGVIMFDRMPRIQRMMKKKKYKKFWAKQSKR